GFFARAQPRQAEAVDPLAVLDVEARRAVPAFGHSTSRSRRSGHSAALFHPRGRSKPCRESAARGSLSERPRHCGAGPAFLSGGYGLPLLLGRLDQLLGGEPALPRSAGT